MRTIRTLITYMFLCAVSSFIIVLPLGAQDVPSEVIKAAAEGLPIFLEKISSRSANNIAPFPAPTSKLPSLKVRHGFEETDSLDRAYVGKPFKYYLLSSGTILNFAGDSDVNSILSQTYQWFFPVMIDKEIKSVLTVGMTKGSWRAQSLGYAVLSRELEKIRQQWPTEKGYTPLLIASIEISQLLFLIRTCFWSDSTIQGEVLYVKEILTQPVVAGWDMIPVARTG